MERGSLCNNGCRRLILTQGRGLGRRVRVDGGGQDVVTVGGFGDTWSSSVVAPKTWVKSIGRDGSLVLQEMPAVKATPFVHVKKDGRFILQTAAQSGCWHPCDSPPGSRHLNQKSDADSLHERADVPTAKAKPPFSSSKVTPTDSKPLERRAHPDSDHHSRATPPSRSHHRSRSLPPTSSPPHPESDFPTSKMTSDFKSFFSSISSTPLHFRPAIKA